MVSLNGFVFDELPLEVVLQAASHASTAGAAIFFDPGPRAWTMAPAKLHAMVRKAHVVLMTQVSFGSLWRPVLWPTCSGQASGVGAGNENLCGLPEEAEEQRLSNSQLVCRTLQPGCKSWVPEMRSAGSMLLSGISCAIHSTVLCAQVICIPPTLVAHSVHQHVTIQRCAK